MKRIRLIGVLLLTTLSLALTAFSYRAAPPVSIKSDFKSRPTFYKQKLKLLDNNRMLYIGRSANWDHPYAYFYDLKTKKKRRLAVPLKDFFSNNRHLLVNGQLSKKMGTRTINSFHLESVHFYDSSRGLIGIIVQNRPVHRGEDRQYFLFWDIKANRITRAILLSKGKAYEYYHFSGGYDADSGLCYLYRYEPANAPLISTTLPSASNGRDNDSGDDRNRDRDDGGDTGSKGDRDNDGDSDMDDDDGDKGMGDDDDARRGLQHDGTIIMPVASRKNEKRKWVSVYAIGMKKVKRIVHFRTHNRLNHAAYDNVRKRLMLPEYTESHYKRTAYGYLVDLKKMSYKKMVVPTTPYGVAFDPDGKTIYVASAQSGYIWAIDAASGRKLRQGYGWTLGHALNFIKPGVLLWLRNASLVFFKTPSLKRHQIIPTSKFYTGFCHVQGSIVTPGRIILQNGNEFRVVDF